MRMGITPLLWIYYCCPLAPGWRAFSARRVLDMTDAFPWPGFLLRRIVLGAKNNKGSPGPGWCAAGFRRSCSGHEGCAARIGKIKQALFQTGKAPLPIAIHQCINY
ncbi:MAG: hypothetical protein ACOY81_00920 [Bacillota bacterium]